MAQIPERQKGKGRPVWLRPVHPVFKMEAQRRVRSRGVNALQRGCLPSILAVTGLLLSGVMLSLLIPSLYWDVEEAAVLTLILSMVILVSIQVMVGGVANMLMVTQTAPMISGEVELQSWRVLRTTSLTLREIIMAKFAAALRYSRGALLGLMVLRVISTITGIIGAIYIVREAFRWDRAAWNYMLDRNLWVLPLLAFITFVLWYLAQPVVNTLVNAALGMFASSLTGSRSRSMAFALGGRLFAWVGGTTLHFALIYGLSFILIGNWMQPYYAQIEFFRQFSVPTPEAAVLVLSLTVILYVVVLAALQVGSILLALRLSERYARRLGA